MNNRKALLVGAEKYREGFADLPAVVRDIQLIESALQASGYEVELCRDEVLENAGKLDRALREFCSSGGPDDIRIIYFSGHGVLVDDVDCIVPAKTSREDAVVSASQRVSTDLSKTVAKSGTGLVLFIIDACRNEEDSPGSKGGGGWGDPDRIERPGEHRFVRFFGCAANQICQVLPSAEGRHPSSLFTQALAESIREGNNVTLDKLFTNVEGRCTKLLAENTSLQLQTPRLSLGGSELSAEKKTLLQRPIFDPVGHAALASVWPSYEPDKLHCLVITSEYEHKTELWGLKDLAYDALGGKTGQRIWKSFLRGCNHQRFTSGKQRMIPEAFKSSNVLLGSFSIIDAFASGEALEKAVRAVVEADLAVFDITGFEPGVMLFIGIRSACCRSLNICSHGAGWQEGQPLEMPFNLQEISINSHAPRETKVGPDPVVERFVQRVEIGFSQLSKHPRYLDLPAFDALRELGSEYEASSTIDVNERILVLCWYEPKFFPNWQFVSSQIERALTERNSTPDIERIIDYGSPQLIWQGLYEQIRRTAGCVVDWSGYSASVFLELGVRLAVSEWGAVQIVDKRYLPGGEEMRNYADFEVQIERMSRIFSPIPYQFPSDDSAAFSNVVDALLQRDPGLNKNAEYNRIHRALLPVIGEIQQAHTPVAEELKRRADALHHTDQDRASAPQILFHDSSNIKKDSKQAALELRIAAWLYLEHRIGQNKLKEDAALRELYMELGRLAKDTLYDLGDDESIELALHIESQLDDWSKN